VDLRPLNVLSFCAGAGGLDLGVRLAVPASRTVCYVENEAYACGVLVARMEEGALDPAPVWTDLRTFDGKPWRGLVDLMVGGYPCTPFSCSGKRGGGADPRHLWPDVARIAGECEPPLLFFENVDGHVSLGLEEVRGKLRGMGYEVEAGLFTAGEVGTPQRRKRLFVLASRGLGLPERVWGLFGLPDVADPVGPGLGGGDQRGLGAAGAAPLQQDDGAHAPDELGDGGEALVGPEGHPVPLFPPIPTDDARWDRVVEEEPLLEPALRPLADGMAGGVGERLLLHREDQVRLLGNGVVPACAAYAFLGLVRQMLRGG